MDGLGQLIFILVIIGFSVVDAVSRNQKKKQRMDEMSREEDAEEVLSAGSSRPRTTMGGRPTPRERREAMRDARREANRPSEHRHVEMAPARSVGGEVEEEVEPEERVTADTLVPEDLWAILTGQAPPSSQRTETPAPRPKPAAPLPEPDTYQAPAPRPDPGDRSGGEETRRSDRWMTGVEGRDESDRWGEGAKTEMEGAPSIYEDEARVYAAIDDSVWSGLEDITAGELGDGRGRTQGVSEEPMRQGKAAGGRSARYVRMVSDGGVEGLRTGMVLREVLGPPVSLRDE